MVESLTETPEQAKKHHESLLKKHSAGHTAPTGHVDAAAEKADKLPTVQ